VSGSTSSDAMERRIGELIARLESLREEFRELRQTGPERQEPVLIESELEQARHYIDSALELMPPTARWSRPPLLLVRLHGLGVAD
jgi:hypothetical protein